MVRNGGKRRRIRTLNMNKFPFRKALVTGGGGFIGSNICERLVNLGVEVVSLDNYSSGKEENLYGIDCVKVNGDITDEALVSEMMDNTDVVFHNAASKKSVCLDDPKYDLDVNAKGTLILLIQALKNKVKKFVHASTGSVYGEPVYFPLDENHSLNPTSYYGVSKLAGEKYVNMFNKMYGLNSTVLRYFHVYGPKQSYIDLVGGVVSIFINRTLNDESVTIFGDGSQQRSFTHVSDVVDANIVAAINPISNGKVYNCASALRITVYELYEKISNLLCKSYPPIYGDWMLGEVKVFDVSNIKIQTELDLKFTCFEEGLRKTIEWFKK